VQSSLYKMLMKKKLILFVIILCGIFSLNNGSGPASFAGQGYTGAPGETGSVCSSCHTTGAFGTTTSTLSITKGGIPVIEYEGGVTYQISVTAIEGMGVPSGYGFQLTVLDANENDMAVFSNPSTNAKISTAINVAGGRTYAEHNGPSSTSTFTFDWVAPAILAGDLTFYYAVNVVNLNGNTGGDNGSNGFSTIVESVPAVKVISAIQMNDEYTLPVLDGTANQVLTTDGAGTVFWANNAAFTGGSTSNDKFRTEGNQNQKKSLRKEEIANLKNEFSLIRSEIEAMKKLIEEITKEEK
jgi:hypothetical protein